MKSTLFTFSLLLLLLSAHDPSDFSSPTYQSLPSSTKLSLLWTQILTTPSPFTFYSPLIAVTLFIEPMSPTFTHVSDTFPFLRKKLIHTVGTIAQAELITDPLNPYTGVFRGVQNVLVRLSVAKKPDFTKTTAQGADDNFTPGMSLKFLRDGLPSVNLMAMFGVNGFPSWNFFGREFSNHIPGAKGVPLKLLSCKFATATRFISTLGLRELGEADEKGKREDENRFPFQLIFSPSDEVKSLFPDHFVAEYTEQLKTIPAGTTLYQVFAVDQPEGERKLIGVLRTKSAFVTSQWADEKLFFQHTMMDHDLEVHPEWEAHSSKFGLDSLFK